MLALRSHSLPVGREIHRERALPEKLLEDLSAYWNLYIDDLTILEVVSEKWMEEHKDGDLGVSQLQASMEKAYQELGVPFSKEKSSSREVRCEKLGALLDGESGRLGVTTARCLDFVSLAMFIMGEDKVPTKWRQIFLGKFVHLVRFRRAIFSMVVHSWERVARFNHSGPLTGKEVSEWMLLCMVMPMYYTDLKAPVSGRVTCSDASPTGGGVCYSVGLTSLGRWGSVKPRVEPVEDKPSIITFEWFAGIGGMSRALARLHLETHQVVVCECDQDCIDILRSMLPGCEVWKDICEVTEDDIRAFFDRWPDAEGVIQSGGSPCQGLSQLSSERQHFQDPRSNLFFQLVRVIKLVKAEAHRRGMWHVGFVENVVCDPEDQKVFRDLTGWHQWLICSGSMSQVRRPRFFWVSEDLEFKGVGLVEPAAGYDVVHIHGHKEPPEIWVCEGWKWMSEECPVSLPTFTRSIPRWRPPVKPAGIAHTPPEARARWMKDDFRFPPYTYKDEFCMERNGHLRVACAAEREILMGFAPGHTRLRKRNLSEDVRCSMVGNSFHTTVVAVLLRQCLVKYWPGVAKNTVETLHNELVLEVRAAQKELYKGRGHKILMEDDETWLDRLEQQSGGAACHSSKGLQSEIMLIQRMAELSSHRGTDVHVDTLCFYRPDRLPRHSIDSRQWVWRVARGWRWQKPDHINILEMEALYHAVRWRASGNRLFHRRFLHLVDSQVVLGVAAKGRTSSHKLRRSLHKYNMLVLALHTFPLLGWVLSHQNPSDEPSRWFEPQ